MTTLCHIGLCGLKVMGQNLVLNMEDHAFRVAVWNRTTSTMQEFVAEHGQGRQIVGCTTLAELVKQLLSPRIVMLMVEAGAPVDSVIDQLVPLLSPGDVIMDGGNSYFKDTERRTKSLEQQGLLYIGTGVSGGEEGARRGPSIMPGGTEKAWPLVQSILQAISAKVGPHEDVPCCDWVGPRGAGHYVKMVHNGIEYGDMQLICEAYAMLKQAAGLSNDQLYDVFAQWNRGELQSYLIEITRDIFSVRDELAEGHMVDKILDRAGAKGTGKWMSQDALDLGMPSTLVTTAVYARCLSAQKDARVQASQLLSGPADTGADRSQLIGDRTEFIEKVRQALYASKIVSYAQGFVQLQAAAREYAWPLDYGLCARLWRGGCIIRAQFLERIMEAFAAQPQLQNLLLFRYFQDAVEAANAAWRDVLVVATRLGIPVPAFSSALAYYDSYRSSVLPANLLQAQRDYFGAHEYERIDRPGKYHTDWLSLRRPPEEP
jgi:6-phosphogluconate dehydrogenase